MLLKGNFIPQVDMLPLTIFHDSFAHDVSVVVVDEHMNAYQPKAHVKARAENRGEPIPVTFIQRKSHPNGLLEYLLVTFVSHPARINSVLPYILDVQPHLQVGDVSPSEAVRTFMGRYVHHC